MKSLLSAESSVLFNALLTVYVWLLSRRITLYDLFRNPQAVHGRRCDPPGVSGSLAAWIKPFQTALKALIAADPER